MLDAVSDRRVLDTGPQPDVRKNMANPSSGHFWQALGTFRKDLIIVLRRVTHHLPHIENEFVADLLMKEVAHGIHKYFPWLPPAIWNRERLAIFPHDPVPDGALASLLRQPRIFLDSHRLKAPSHRHRIAMSAACGNNRAPRDRVPSGICPLDLGFSHGPLLSVLRCSVASRRSTHGVGGRKALSCRPDQQQSVEPWTPKQFHLPTFLNLRTPAQTVPLIVSKPADVELIHFGGHLTLWGGGIHHAEIKIEVNPFQWTVTRVRMFLFQSVRRMGRIVRWYLTAVPDIAVRPPSHFGRGAGFELSGFSLHAGAFCQPHARGSPQRLCRYIVRPALSNERLSVNESGQPP